MGCHDTELVFRCSERNQRVAERKYMNLRPPPCSYHK